MSYHIISIDLPDCNITVRDGQLRVYSKEIENSIPLEDVASIVITSFRCNMSSNFLIEAAKKKIGVILCEHFKPISILLPTDRATDTQVIRNLAQLPLQQKRRFWKKTIHTKCHNQLTLARLWNPNHHLIADLEHASMTDKDSKESECAKLYWNIFSDTFTDGQFKRNRALDDLNIYFNYAYAILLSCVLRNLLALGIDPMFGIFHATREHSTPLAYDLMEPFRAAFDLKIAQWISSNPDITGKSSKCFITKEFRKYITNTLLEATEYENKSMPFKSAIEHVVRSFRAALLLLQTGPYEPWKISTTKWDG